MKKKTQIAGAITLGLGLVLAPALTTTAQAHTGDLFITATCNLQTGQYDFVATQQISNTTLTGSTVWRIGTSTFDGTPSSATGMNLGPISSTGSQLITLGTWSMPGTTTGLGPWVYSYTTWTDGYKKGADGQLLKALDGKCAVPPTVVTIPPSIDHTDPCGPDNLVVNLPEGTEGVTYTQEATDNSGIKVTATADKGYALTLDGENTFDSYTWQFEDSNDACPTTPTPTPPPTPELPYTGADIPMWVPFAGLALLVSGNLLWVAGRRREKKNAR